MNVDTTSGQSPSLNSGEDWPYGLGMCCCGCGKKARVVDGASQKFYRKYHERWLQAKVKRETPPERRSAERICYPTTQSQKPLPDALKRSRPNKFAIAKHLPGAFNVSQSEINKAYTDNERGGSTASEREKLFPQLNAPTVVLNDLFRNAVADPAEVDTTTPKQTELFGSNEKPQRLNRQLAWIKANKPLLEAISRARDRADIAVKGAYIRNREKVDIEFRLLQRIRGRISAVLNGRVKNTSTLRLLGCTVPELRAHLEKQFVVGMSWANYGRWHVDHIRPCASFDFKDPTALLQCFNYTNLQPMWGADNAKKNSRWEGKLIRRKKQS